MNKKCKKNRISNLILDIICLNNKCLVKCIVNICLILVEDIKYSIGIISPKVSSKGSDSD